jgi:hypothetical protein
MLLPTDPTAAAPLAELDGVPASALTSVSLATDAQSLLAYARALPITVDEAQRRSGLEIYDQMDRDGAVKSSARKWKLEILSDGYRLSPPKGFEKDELAQEIVAFWEAQFDALPCQSLFWQMLDAMKWGHAVAEQTWGDGCGQWAGKWCLSDLRVIPPKLYTIVVDVFGRFLGVIGRVPGQIPITWSGLLILDIAKIPGFVPYQKLCLFTHDPQAGNLNGTSRYEGCYNAWRLKTRNWGEYLQYLSRWSGVIPVGISGPDAASGTVNVSANEFMAEQMARLASGSAIGLSYGSSVTFWAPPSGPMPYLTTIDGLNREIARSILGNSRATVESEHGSKADSATAQDGVDEDIKFHGRSLCEAIRRQVIRPLTLANWGPDAPVPVLILGEDTDDRVALAGAAGNLKNAGLLDSAARREYVAEHWFGLPIDTENDDLPAEENEND